MKTAEDEAFDELEKAQQRKVATGVTDGSKVTIDRAKLEQVLEALERVNTVHDDCDILAPSLADAVVNALDDIKEALEDV